MAQNGTVASPLTAIEGLDPAVQAAIQAAVAPLMAENAQLKAQIAAGPAAAPTGPRVSLMSERKADGSERLGKNGKPTPTYKLTVHHGCKGAAAITTTPEVLRFMASDEARRLIAAALTEHEAELTRRGWKGSVADATDWTA